MGDDLPGYIRSRTFNTREEWLKWRNETGFGASEASAFFEGANKWQSAAEVILRKVTQEPAEEREDLRIREDLEDSIVRMYVRKTRRIPHQFGDGGPDKRVCWRQETPHIIATPDVYARVKKYDETNPDPLNGICLVELKTAAFTADDWETVPLGYVVQMQQQMYCTGIPRCDLAVLFFGGNKLDFKVYEFEADREFQGILVERLTEMWKIVLARRAGENVPLPDGGPNDGKLLARWLAPKPATVVQLAEADLALAREMLGHAEQRAAHRKIADGFDELHAAAKNALVTRANGAELLTFPNSDLKFTSKVVKRAGYEVGASEWVDLKETKR